MNATVAAMLLASFPVGPPSVSLADAERMPLLKVCEDNTKFAKAHLDYLGAVLANSVREDEVAYYAARYEDANLRWWIWDAARMARDGRFGDDNRLAWLRYLRQTLTDGEWDTGALRPPAPFHLFAGID